MGMNNKIIAVILTQNGADYTDAGKNYVANHLKKNYNASQITLLGGKIYNKPNNLKNLLDKNPLLLYCQSLQLVCTYRGLFSSSFLLL